MLVERIAAECECYCLALAPGLWLSHRYRFAITNPNIVAFTIVTSLRFVTHAMREQG